jgi:heme exporter protein D
MAYYYTEFQIFCLTQYLLYLWVLFFSVSLVILYSNDYIQSVRKRLHILRGYSTHLNEQNVPVNTRPEANAC